ncbi:hypothetical protein PR048_023414 [Dryococelus australis]|uniref:UDP-N-acetylglucosamine transferase subunit ALG13 n=1 Tax=Dryococelus australis TaxID=614101 RepID=A0ABQ9GU43_9NEOP|nr:hypothetical protein PR048_023414 [Dryococelus australis]
MRVVHVWLQVLKWQGYDRVMLQTGRGPPPALATGQQVYGVRVEHYGLKESIAEDIARAGLVVSHGGAGTCLEVLEAGKPLVVVANHELMDDHQLELAEQLHTAGHAYCCNIEQLASTLLHVDPSKLRPFPRGDPSAFVCFLDNMLGL